MVMSPARVPVGVTVTVDAAPFDTADHNHNVDGLLVYPFSAPVALFSNVQILLPVSEITAVAELLPVVTANTNNKFPAVGVY
jgi:hypothetical protein